jgi:transcriptional regulator with XRE-family HTH domain
MKDPQILRSRRQRLGLGLRQLARAMRISAPYLREMELGTRRLTPAMRERHRAALASLKEPNARPTPTKC